jgi:tetratricopeptide (TPR) repeat protein
MRNYNKDLQKGAKYIAQKKYTRAIRYLEPKVPVYLEDDNFYYLLGLALYHSGDMGNARFYFERGLLANRDNIDLKLMLAMAHLKRKDSASAAKTWLSVLESDPENKRAERGLEALRKIDNERDLNIYIESGKHKKLMPRFQGRPLWPAFIIILAVLIFVSGLIFLIPRLSLPRLPEKDVREELNYIDLDISGIPVTDNTGSFYYVLTVDEVNETYNKAITLFDKRKDNMAQVEINRLMNSNAAPALKSRLSTLEGYLVKPDYADFYTDYTFTQISRDPRLYENCWVLWRGKVSNLVYHK